MTETYHTFHWHQGGRFALFSDPFRPFFLLGAAWSALSLGLWLSAMHGSLGVPLPYGGIAWHAHEMVYGFGAAIVGGFLLTAVPSWTGQPKLLGHGLATTCALWLAGRVAVMSSGTLGVPLAAVLDLAFLTVLSGRTLHQVIAARNWRNIPVAAAPMVLLAGNALVHAEAAGLTATASLGNRLGVLVMVTLIALIGGRIIPAFTGNWLNNSSRGGPLPVTWNRFDSSIVLLTVATFVLWLVAPAHAATGGFAAASALAHTLRLARWRGWRTVSEPLVWILHLGYAWLPLGFAVMTASAFVPAAVPGSVTLHAFAAGAMGTMMLAVMTRATLGHTGRRLSAGKTTTAIYLAIMASGLCRVAAVLAPAHYALLLSISGSVWIAAFLLYLLVYAPMLCGARVASA